LGGFLATRHLIDLGHRRIGLISGPLDASNAVGRVEGYHQAMRESGLELRPEWIAASTFGLDSGHQAARRLMDQVDRPTAIFAVNDNTAIGALSALAQLGLSVPGDVSVVGYNDIPIVSHLATPLTTVRIPFEQVASQALDQLLSANAGKGPTISRAAPTLIPRQSTGRPAKHS
ncbi:MAG: LacI family transcriptional regulator, partial [Sphingomonadales bacterium]